jgi:tRNA (cytidine/uridine-2'-O-)-methyltransferase
VPRGRYTPIRASSTSVAQDPIRPRSPTIFQLSIQLIKMARLHVVLVAPEIHWNTGNVGRTCLAVNADLHLIEPLGFSLSDKQVRRAGLDYWPRVRLTVWPDWNALVTELPRMGAAYFFAARAPRSFDQVEYAESTVLVFGRESVGLPAAILHDHAGSVVSIPMLDPQLRSLNLSTSVAVAAYEFRRQWAGKG